MSKRKFATDAEYLQDQLKVIEGAVVEKVEVFDMNDINDGLSLRVKLKDGRTALVDVYRDPEGNGPGFLNLNPISATPSAAR